MQRKETDAPPTSTSVTGWTKNDFDQITSGLSDFWGDDHTRALHLASAEQHVRHGSHTW